MSKNCKFDTHCVLQFTHKFVATETPPKLVACTIFKCSITPHTEMFGKRPERTSKESSKFEAQTDTNRITRQTLNSYFRATLKDVSRNNLILFIGKFSLIIFDFKMFLQMKFSKASEKC